MSITSLSTPPKLLAPPHAAALNLHSSFLPIFTPIPKPTKPLLSLKPSCPLIITSSLEAGIGVMGTKLGMMSLFDSSGVVVPVTVIGFREGNIVTQVKTEATDGYNAVQVGYRRVRDKKLTKPGSS